MDLKQEICEIGFWYNDSDCRHLPMPEQTCTKYADGFIEKIQRWYDNTKDVHDDFYMVNQNVTITFYMGYSKCRICSKQNGDGEITFKNYKFPAGYFHYILDHNIYVPGEFQDMIINNNVPTFSRMTDEERAKYWKEKLDWDTLRIMSGMSGLATTC